MQRYNVSVKLPTVLLTFFLFSSTNMLFLALDGALQEGQRNVAWMEVTLACGKDGVALGGDGMELSCLWHSPLS